MVYRNEIELECPVLSRIIENGLTHFKERHLNFDREINLIFRTDGKASFFFIKYTLDFHEVAVKVTNDRYDTKGVT